MNVDFIVVVAYGNLVSEEILNHPRYFTLNVHASLLPKWRGAAPVQRSILEGDKETGVTIMKVEKKLDAGPIVNQIKFKILDDDNGEKIFNKMIKFGKPLLLETIKFILKKDYSLITQSDDKASYAKKIQKKETKISWDQSATIINRQIRAFSPVPGAWTTIKSLNKRIKILKSKIISENIISEKSNKNGSVTDGLIVKCGKNFIQITQLQPEGKSIMNANDFLNGLKVKELFFE